MMRWLLLVLLCSTALALPPTFSTPKRVNARRPAAASSFVPTDISGLLMWLAADDGVTNASDVNPPADGEVVKGWKDKSGSGNFMLGATRPVYETGIQNGKPVIRFTSATSHFMSNTFGASLNGSGTSTTVALIGAVSATNISSVFVTLFNSADGDSLWDFASLNTSLIRSFKRDNGGTGNAISGAGSSPNVFVNITWVVSGTTCTIYTNNAQMATGTYTAGNTTFNFTWLGRTGSTYMGGDIGEVLVYNSALSSGDRTLLYDYLKTRWATP